MEPDCTETRGHPLKCSYNPGHHHAHGYGYFSCNRQGGARYSDGPRDSQGRTYAGTYFDTSPDGDCFAALGRYFRWLQRLPVSLLWNLRRQLWLKEQAV